jgi:Zn-dependent oligopeptidase
MEESVEEREREYVKEGNEERKNNKKLFASVNNEYALLSQRRKNYILLETKKWFIIVKFDYYKPFAYFVEDAYVI